MPSVLCQIMSHFVVLCYVKPFHLYYVVLCYVILCCVLPCQVTLYHVMLYYVVPPHVSYAMLCLTHFKGSPNQMTSHNFGSQKQNYGMMPSYSTSWLFTCSQLLLGLAQFGEPSFTNAGGSLLSFAQPSPAWCRPA